jgi:hypothetical protein
MADRKDEERRPRAVQGQTKREQQRPAPVTAPALTRLPEARYAGVAVRRAPPPAGSPADAPWRIMPVPVSYDDNLTRKAGAAGHDSRLVEYPPVAGQRGEVTPETGSAADASHTHLKRRPVFPLPAALEATPDPERGGRGGADGDPFRGVNRIRDDKTPNPDEPNGPDLERAAALVKALATYGDERKASQGRPRRDADADAYVTSAGTQAKALRRGKSLFRSFVRESGVQQMDAEDADPRDFVDWLFSRKVSLKMSSWRTYRAAGLAQVQTVPHTSCDEAVAMLVADIGSGADEGRATQRGRRVGLAPSARAKRFDKTDFDQALHQIWNLSRSDAVPWVRDWLSAGINTGLRPLEWASADLEVSDDPSRSRGRRALLYVVNANASRIIGAVYVQRTLDISNFSDEALDAVRRMVDRAGEWTLAKQFEMRQSQCAQILYEVCATLFPLQRQRYSFYSLRHQFIANMETIYEPAKVAALVGHLDNETADEQYGKRRSAWLKEEIREVPVPMPALVKRMSKQLKLCEQRRKTQRAIENRRAARKAKKSEPKR